MPIYVIRHGQTDWNAEGRLQGARDVPLNDHGRAQATGNGVRLARLIGADAQSYDFVCSPLGRTRETMELVRRAMGLDASAYRTDDRLIEVCFGDWEGYTLPEIDAATPGVIAAREADKWYYLPPGGNAESYETLSRRVADWLRSVERPTVCVCHGGVIRSLFKIVGGVAPDDAAMMPAHQDRIAMIEKGTMRWLARQAAVS